jgi:site-specific DNA-methyltransferase (adenine-specific)
MKSKVIQGNNIDVLKTFANNSFDSIVTDPPYGIDFLDKAWDATTGALETYQQCLRVLKPGGYILAFGHARTYHHLAVTIEQAGFEIRDQIMWIQSNGFPKSDQLLKPAHEPICMARKPGKDIQLDLTQSTHNGRLPSNVLGQITGYEKYFYAPRVSKQERHLGHEIPAAVYGHAIGAFDPVTKQRYAVALDQRDAGNSHPTVKPIELMKYLVKLVTPAEGRVLDPFNGSGSTGCAAVELDMDYTGIELDQRYVDIACKRIQAWYDHTHANTFRELFEYE